MHLDPAWVRGVYGGVLKREMRLDGSFGPMESWEVLKVDPLKSPFEKPVLWMDNMLHHLGRMDPAGILGQTTFVHLRIFR